MQPKFYCEKCDFKCCKQSIYNTHLETVKHKKSGYIRIHPEKKDTIVSIHTEKISEGGGHICPYCFRSYKYHSGVWRHKSVCKYKCNIDDELPQTDTNVIIHKKPTSNEEQTHNKLKHLTAENREIKMKMTMMLQMMTTNTQFQSHLMELMNATQTQITNYNQSHTQTQTSTMCAPVPGVALNGDHATFNNTNTNSHNNTFNMNFFLNEKCKDAMNMKDFVNSIQLNLTDLENVGRLGYVEGMSNIFIDNLQKTDVYKRPVHCSDVKRETLYVKDDNQWERDGPDHSKMMNAVLAVEQKNVALINEWAKTHPRCMNSNTRDNETYFRLSKAATDGEKDGNIAKVIRKVAKNVAIEKDM
jgi:hypothetical protein